MADRLSDRILAFLDNWTEEAIGYSCAEIASALGCDATDVQLVLAALEQQGLAVSVEVEGVTYYVSQLARVEKALADLVQAGEVTVREGPNGELLYQAADATPLRGGR